MTLDWTYIISHTRSLHWGNTFQSQPA